ncbi:SUA5 synthase, partial [Copsychus sechellarum]|nr:SUA5 synthase [Copsychus sechellarum]
LILIGGFVQLLAGFLAFRKYDHLGGAAFLTFSALWSSYGATKVLCAAPLSGHLLGIGAGNTEGFTAGSVAFLVLNAFLIILASSFNVVLLCLTLAMELLTVCFLLFTLENLPLPFEIVVLSILSIICFYGAAASLTNCMFGKDLLVMGPPLLTVQSSRKDREEPLPCVCPQSHLTSGLRTIAELLNTGAVCGVPTDTVYALAASCKHPQAIEKVYRIKDRPQEKPICIFISNLEQLRAAAPPISPLLWEFMENTRVGHPGAPWSSLLIPSASPAQAGTVSTGLIHPSPGSWECVEIAQNEGTGGAGAQILVAVVFSPPHRRLGHKLEGVLCDGESDEVVASTVVNCTRIDESGITIVREGCIPAGKVMQIFERVKNR